MSEPFRLLPAKHLEHLKKIFIYYDKRNVRVSLICYQEDSINLTIEYHQLGPDTKVTNNRNKTECSVKDDDFVSVFCRDLVMTLVKRPKLEHFSMYCCPSEASANSDPEYRKNYLNPVRTRILKELTNILRRTGPEKMKSKILYIGSDNIDVLAELLSCFDPNSLIRASIGVEYDDSSINFHPLWTLDLWKVERPPQVTISISVMRYSVLELLKEVFFQHSYIREVAIECKSVNPDCRLFFEGADKKSFYCLTLRIPITENVGIDIERRHKRFKFIRTFFKDGNYHRYDKDLSDLSSSELHYDITNVKVDDERCLKVLGNKIIMKKLTGYLKFEEVQSLLKVSHLVRHTIKELKLDFQITKYIIAGLGVGEKASCTLSNDKCDTSVTYSSSGQGCIVGSNSTCKRRYKTEYLHETGIFIPEDYRIQCLKDFAVNMEHQKASLELYFLEIINYKWERLVNIENIENSENHPSEFIKIFEDFFETTNKLIRTKSLMIDAISHHHIIGVLKHIDPNCLKNIMFRGPRDIFRSRNTQKHILELDEMCKMDQWQSLDSIFIHDLIVSTRIQEFDVCKFSSGEITVNILTTDDLRYLKEGFLTSPSLEKFKINIMNCEIDDTVNLIVGWPFRVANPLLRNQRSVWFFPVPDTNKFLHIVYHVPHTAVFRHCDQEDVPEEYFENVAERFEDQFARNLRIV